MTDYKKEMAKIISGHINSQRLHCYDKWDVFRDFCALSALSISNAVDKAQYDVREARYMEIVKRYDKEAVDMFSKLLGMLAGALEEDTTDVLGQLFHDLELHNKWVGQFFTPIHVADMMGRISIVGMEEKIKEQGFVTVSEPAAGAGAMVLGLAKAMKEAGYNYQEQMHVTAVDIDERCAHMCYLQLSLLGIPAVVVHGNTLSLEEFGRWYTPAHVWGGWGWKLQNDESKDDQVVVSMEEKGQLEFAL